MVAMTGMFLLLWLLYTEIIGNIIIGSEAIIVGFTENSVKVSQITENIDDTIDSEVIISGITENSVNIISGITKNSVNVNHITENIGDIIDSEAIISGITENSVNVSYITENIGDIIDSEANINGITENSVNVSHITEDIGDIIDSEAIISGITENSVNVNYITENIGDIIDSEAIISGITENSVNESHIIENIGIIIDSEAKINGITKNSVNLGRVTENIVEIIDSEAITSGITENRLNISDFTKCIACKIDDETINTEISQDGVNISSPTGNTENIGRVDGVIDSELIISGITENSVISSDTLGNRGGIIDNKVLISDRPINTKSVNIVAENSSTGTGTLDSEALIIGIIENSVNSSDDKENIGYIGNEMDSFVRFGRLTENIIIVDDTIDNNVNETYVGLLEDSVSIRDNNVNLTNANRSSRVLNFFPIPVSVECLSDDGRRTGTCLNTYECRMQGGRAHGPCALGFGVCCVFTATCGAEVFNNVTYFVSPSFPELSRDVSNCHINIKKMDPSISQLRFDFIHFSMGQPNRRTGVCDSDVFTVSGSPMRDLKLCGQNSGQHVYYDVENVEGLISIAMNLTRSNLFRLWEIKITQIEFNQRAPAGCMQYFHGSTGIIQTMNFADNGRHLADQDYGICMRQEEGMCSIAYEPCDENSFKIGPAVMSDTGSGDGVLGDSRECDDKIVMPCDSEELIMPEGGGPGFCDLLHCGSSFCTQGETPCRIESSTIPFSIRVQFGPGNKEESPEDNLGMCLQYEQLPCSV